MLYIRIKEIVELLLIRKNFIKCNEESSFLLQNKLGFRIIDYKNIFILHYKFCSKM